MRIGFVSQFMPTSGGRASDQLRFQLAVSHEEATRLGFIQDGVALVPRGDGGREPVQLRYEPHYSDQGRYYSFMGASQPGVDVQAVRREGIKFEVHTPEGTKDLGTHPLGSEGF